MRKIIPLILLALLILIGCSKDKIEEPQDEGINKSLLLLLVNEQRAQGCLCGDKEMAPTNPLSWNETLEEAAQIHSDDMYDNSHFDHTGTDESTPPQRLQRVGYKYTTWGENISYNYYTEESTTRAWINSPPHCRNIMNPSFTEMGVARSGNYWTQVFADRKK